MAKQLLRSNIVNFNVSANQSETKIICGNHVFSQIGTNWTNFIQKFPYTVPVKYCSILPCVFRREDYFMFMPMRNKNCSRRPCLHSHKAHIFPYLSYKHTFPSLGSSFICDTISLSCFCNPLCYRICKISEKTKK